MFSFCLPISILLFYKVTQMCLEVVSILTRETISRKADRVIMKNNRFSVNDIKEPAIPMTHLRNKTAHTKCIRALIRSVIVVFIICTIDGFRRMFGFESTVIYEKIKAVVFSTEITVRSTGPISLQPFFNLGGGEVFSVSQDKVFSRQTIRNRELSSLCGYCDFFIRDDVRALICSVVMKAVAIKIDLAKAGLILFEGYMIEDRVFTPPCVSE